MASSDDEGETVVKDVSDYEFTYGVEDESISFAELPVEWSEGEARDGKKQQIYLKGKTDSGCRKVYIQVTAWKFDLLKGKPEISVLSVHGNWIKLLKPRKPFYSIIRTVLVTVHVLHFAKWDPKRSEKALWDNLDKTFSMFERRPCVDDLADHVPLITEAIKRDEKLAKSKILSEFLAEKPWEKKTFNEDVKPSFIVDDVNEKEDVVGESDKTDFHEDSDSEEGEDSDSEDGDCFDSVCAICDNGGNLYICDGKCMRSFHATVDDGDDSACESLGLTDAELEAIKNVPFICENCKYKKHQCFACGKLGSSDESNPEVFCCVNGACGYFYHPRCVSRLFHPEDNAAAEKLHKRISAGEPFACPIHRCDVCEELEVRSQRDLQFAVCRRCPKAYHRKCLPSEITLEDSVDVPQRAWEDLIPKRILIYCLAHTIDPDISTPPRDHIIFPGPWREKKKKPELESSKNKNLSKERGLASEDNAGNKISVKQQKANGSKGGGLSRKRLEELPTRPFSKKQKLAAKRNSCVKLKESTKDEGGVSSGDDGSYATFCDMDSEPVNSCSLVTGHGNNEITTKAKPTPKRTDDALTLDADARRRVLTLMKDASSSITLEEVRKRHKPPSTHVPYSRFSADNVTLGKVEGSIQAIHAALKKLDVDGGSVQDAKAVCGNELLEQVFRWKEKLKVYLAPFLYGMRYTSFGRHFTKMDKLMEIVDILHWYVQDGDMLVDFCCGSNDFSCFMKKKLDEMGRLCSFKNYDILQPKNDFNFERRDWMGVKQDELPDGSQLIMGLNPPFGVNAALANKFINKALEFKPKLLILIVPRETQRLDEKESPYDLIWEDDQMLAGKSFYLPGSVDVNDKQIEDWNVTPPVLYLWSRPDFTPKHRDIAEQHPRLSSALKSNNLDGGHNELPAPDAAEASDHKSPIGDEDKHADTPKDPEQTGKEIIIHQEDLPREAPSTEAGKNHAPVKNHSGSSSKNFGGKGNKKRPSGNRFLKNKSCSKLSESRPRLPHTGTYPSEHVEAPSQVRSERGDHQQQHLNESNLSVYRQPPYSQTEHNGNGYQQLTQSNLTPYHHHQQQQQQQHQQQQHYSQTAGVGIVDDDLLMKYVEPHRGMASMHAYSESPRHAYGRSPIPDYGFAGSSDQQRLMESPPPYPLHQNVHGRELQQQPNHWYPPPSTPLRHYHETVYPPPPPPLHQRNIAAASGGTSTPVADRYAPRLDEAHHSMTMPYGHLNHAPPVVPRGYNLGPRPQPQLPSQFAPGPYRPSYSQQHSSTGWLQE
ncbi:hypothetical protein C2S52_005880 [Perilla frutescens var. hirtella]|nr:hypothetical protein C2S52_005880 [Perilla frutescens var. hirtella]